MANEIQETVVCQILIPTLCETFFFGAVLLSNPLGYVSETENARDVQFSLCFCHCFHIVQTFAQLHERRYAGAVRGHEPPLPVPSAFMQALEWTIWALIIITNFWATGLIFIQGMFLETKNPETGKHGRHHEAHWKTIQVFYGHINRLSCFQETRHGFPSLPVSRFPLVFFGFLRQHRRFLRSLCSKEDFTSNAEKTLAFLVESGAFYLCIWIPRVDSTHQGIYPTMIVIVVAMQLSAADILSRPGAEIRALDSPIVFMRRIPGPVFLICKDETQGDGKPRSRILHIFEGSWVSLVATLYKSGCSMRSEFIAYYSYARRRNAYTFCEKLLVEQFLRFLSIQYPMSRIPESTGAHLPAKLMYLRNIRYRQGSHGNSHSQRGARPSHQGLIANLIEHLAYLHACKCQTTTVAETRLECGGSEIYVRFFRSSCFESAMNHVNEQGAGLIDDNLKGIPGAAASSLYGKSGPFMEIGFRRKQPAKTSRIPFGSWSFATY
ncbi:hypothetical protein F5148DRAFT_1150931 [Russula earlei]|uniref:Uncharacterized protein n=1 Tax=Russula earlei TaxID=71964 RepID=A0ACC0U218_9AGAM|nr:hypothetical protein F5148DRAFT_1150931 [Russula earlei]